eukprot:CAMPEP_0197689164 /NCGR_PEP_ID=MMETSP1338-20131121/106455_1 /TAXON_ID=43686 ORGANISM="Pelagodinium beii, Strain RCC1491" /NCGR_SAMPLE_ID=MMETSP1338 /ASSEMBLY_ACC=CAM_ASM_000754 /LENGTH=67 /DNA_ID=CAMNT_0043271471 /DNA_START=353 /DNA_END=552 /DNA_ORIENTATION=+
MAWLNSLAVCGSSTKMQSEARERSMATPQDSTMQTATSDVPEIKLCSAASRRSPDMDTTRTLGRCVA